MAGIRSRRGEEEQRVNIEATNIAGSGSLLLPPKVGDIG